jgi:hypothetical protein
MHMCAVQICMVKYCELGHPFHFTLLECIYVCAIN